VAGTRGNASDTMDCDAAIDPIDRKVLKFMGTTTTRLRIGPADSGRAMTLEDFLDAEVEEGCRYELARGVLEATQVPNDPHRQVVTNLYVAIAHYLWTHPEIVLSFGGGSEFQFVVPAMASGRNPDLGVVLRGAAKDWRGRSVPALAAEVVSRGSVMPDYETKRAEYLAYGLLEYWIVDPLKRQVTVLSRQGDAWDEADFRDEQVVGTRVLPGFTTTVAELWNDVAQEEEPDEASGADADAIT
jgi:Uma2 family endonuclease